MGVLAVNTLKRAVVGAVRAREKERETVEGRTSGALCVKSVHGGDNEDREKEKRRSLKGNRERRKRRREQRRADWRRNANPNYERSLSPVRRCGGGSVDSSLSSLFTRPG